MRSSLTVSSLAVSWVNLIFNAIIFASISSVLSVACVFRSKSTLGCLDLDDICRQLLLVLLLICCALARISLCARAATLTSALSAASTSFCFCSSAPNTPMYFVCVVWIIVFALCSLCEFYCFAVQLRGLLVS